MTNSNDIIRNRTRDLLACSAVPQLTEPARVPNVCSIAIYLYVRSSRWWMWSLLSSGFNTVQSGTQVQMFQESLVPPSSTLKINWKLHGKKWSWP